MILNERRIRHSKINYFLAENKSLLEAWVQSCALNTWLLWTTWQTLLSTQTIHMQCVPLTKAKVGIVLQVIWTLPCLCDKRFYQGLHVSWHTSWLQAFVDYSGDHWEINVNVFIQNFVWDGIKKIRFWLALFRIDIISLSVNESCVVIGSWLNTVGHGSVKCVVVTFKCSRITSILVLKYIVKGSKVSSAFAFVWRILLDNFDNQGKQEFLESIRIWRNFFLAIRYSCSHHAIADNILLICEHIHLSMDFKMWFFFTFFLLFSNQFIIWE